MSYLQAAMYYFVYYVNDTDYKVFRNFLEDFLENSPENLQRCFDSRPTRCSSFVI